MKANKFVPFMLRRGDGSTLSLDFTAMSSLDSRFTFSRSSTATFINSAGLVTSASTNVPRFDHDPTTLAPRGLLLEGSATNLLTYSEDFNAAAWTDTSITRATGNTDPAGGATAVRFTASSGNATVIRAAAIGTTTTRTFSIFLRRVTGTGNIDYTLNNGSTYTTQAITGSWVRYTFTATSANHQVGIRIVTSGDAIEMWGAQLETASGASSYIPTGSGTVQRAGDVCYITPNTSWFNLAEGTVFEETAAMFQASGFSRFWGFVEQTTAPFSTQNNSITLGLSGSNGRPFLNVTENNINRGDAFIPAGGAISQNTFFKMSSCYKQGDYRISRAGTSGTLTYSATYPTSLPTLHFAGINGAHISAVWYKSWKYFPTRLPNAQMDAWSA
jgi:hypothetical protein